MDLLIAREKVIRTIRAFFHHQGFLETDTPSLVVSPGMETHIRPIKANVKVGGKDAYLPTSPEFAMKRILARGYPKIFQICKAYRDEPVSTTHFPEFTMLEWYRANSGFEKIMDDVEALFSSISSALDQEPQKFLRFTIEECFRRFANVDLVQLIREGNIFDPKWEDQFFLIMMNEVEPKLERLGQPVILTHYPECQAALANLVEDPRGIRWAKRFEVYAGGFELGNAFDELTDAVEQRRRFEKDMATRKKIYGDVFPPNPVDEDFLGDLQKMPPSAGIAMGVDRLVMYFTKTSDIRDVLWVPSSSPN